MNDKKHFKILIAEDNPFYNQLLTNQLKWYTGEKALHEDWELEIDSCSNTGECMLSINEKTDLAFIDYYLEDGKTALGIIRKLKEKSPDCKIIVLSQAPDAKNMVQSLKEKMLIDFIYKDNNALPKTCFLAEELMNEKSRTIH